MTRVRLLRDFRCYSVGDEVSLPSAKAEGWIANGIAVFVAEEPIPLRVTGNDEPDSDGP